MQLNGKECMSQEKACTYRYVCLDLFTSPPFLIMQTTPYKQMNIVINL